MNTSSNDRPRRGVFGAERLKALLAAAEKNPSLFIVILIALFAVSFAAPLYFAVNYGGKFLEQEEEWSEPDQIFPQAVPILAANSYIKIDDAAELDPKADSDFLLALWFNARRLPPADEPQALLAKYDSATRTRSGFMVTLVRDKESETVHPEVYWKNIAGKGGWHRFSNIAFKPRSWTLLTMSFRDNRYLGMHAMTIGDGDAPDLQLLGGYEIEDIIPRSQSPLLVGAFNSGRFRGAIGPISVFSGPQLSKHFKEILQALIDAPRERPSVVTAEETKLWLVDGKRDESGAAHPVKVFKLKGGDPAEKDVENKSVPLPEGEQGSLPN